MCMSKQFNEFIKCTKIYCLLAPRLWRRLLGALPYSLLRLWAGQAGWLYVDVTIAAAIATARCSRRRLYAPTQFKCLWGHGVTTPLAPLQTNTASRPSTTTTTTSLRSTGIESPATPGDNQDVGSRSSWESVGWSEKELKSAKYSKIKIHAKYSRLAETNTKSSTIRCNNLCWTISRVSTAVLAIMSVVLQGVSKICNKLIFTWLLLIALIGNDSCKGNNWDNWAS